MNKERQIRALPGGLMFLVIFGLMEFNAYQWIQHKEWFESPVMVGMGFVVAIAFLVSWSGFFINQPNYATAMVLFGQYKGTVRGDGWFWTNPFYSKQKVSLRAQTLNGQTLKVNDHVGNPVEIAAVIVWRVEDTYRALFDVEHYAEYVAMQSETALRHLATSYPYDAEDHELSLMRNPDEISKFLLQELVDRLDRAGIDVLEARLSHLAYAQEIAGVMLRKQQAAAIIAARQRIVEGAVTMVQMALEHLERDKVVEMDMERKAQMVSNLLVVLCGETNAQPVLNTGSVY